MVRSNREPMISFCVHCNLRVLFCMGLTRRTCGVVFAIACSSSETALREALVAERAHCAKVRQELLDQLNAMDRTRTVDIANLKKTIAQHDAEAKAREQALAEQLKSVSSLFV